MQPLDSSYSHCSPRDQGQLKSDQILSQFDIPDLLMWIWKTALMSQNQTKIMDYNYFFSEMDQ